MGDVKAHLLIAMVLWLIKLMHYILTEIDVKEKEELYLIFWNVVVMQNNCDIPYSTESG